MVWFYFLLLSLSSCGILLKENYFSEQNMLELPSVNFSNSANLDKSKELTSKLKMDNLPSVVQEGVVLKKIESFLFTANAPVAETPSISPPNIFLPSVKIPFPEYQSLPNITLGQLNIPKPVVKPSIPFFE
jgi:hypothetical protein